MKIGQPHIVKSFDAELNRLEDAVVRMGHMACSQLEGAIAALGGRDDLAAQALVQGDRQIDELRAFVDEQTIRLLALRAPLADDLRIVIAAIKVVGDIERIADHAANTAKRALVLNQTPPMAPMRTLVRLGELVVQVLGQALDAYRRRDDDLALVVRARDQEVDSLYSSLFREILTYMMEDPRSISAASHLMFIAKNVERVGDHATNIAEMTHFMVTGTSPADPRPKSDVSAFEGPPSRPPTAERRRPVSGRRKRDRLA